MHLPIYRDILPHIDAGEALQDRPRRARIQTYSGAAPVTDKDAAAAPRVQRASTHQQAWPRIALLALHDCDAAVCVSGAASIQRAGRLWRQY
eukprot:SAG31_NODE_134_length_23213_cov_5.698624_16_plen_92_part_00